MPDAYAGGLCDAQRPSTSVTYEIEKTRYEKSVSFRTLTMMHSNGKQRVLGTAGGNVGSSFNLKFEMEPVKGSQDLFCLQLKDIDAVFYAKPVIHIASEFRLGTCEYNRVLAHENKHVKTLKREHKRAMPSFSKHMRLIKRILPDLEPVTMRSMPEQQKIYGDIVKDHINSFVEALSADVAKEQAKIDTPEEYAKVWKRCEKWEERMAND